MPEEARRPRRTVSQMNTSPTVSLRPNEVLDVLAWQEELLYTLTDRIQALEHRLTDIERGE